MILRFFIINIFILSFSSFPYIGYFTNVEKSYAQSYATKKTKNKEEEAPDLVDSGIVKEILKSNMILLENNKSYKLENIRVPIDYSSDAIKELTVLLVGKNVFLYNYNKGPNKEDRYGNIPVQVIREADGIWVQDYLISKGLSWAYSTDESRKMVSLLNKIEKIARANKLGFWANPSYALKDPETVKEYLNSYQIIEGRVRRVKVRKLAAYLYFGKDWKTDFTVVLKKSDWQKFYNKETRFIPKNWEGRSVRVHGWIESHNGPMMPLTHPEQIYVYKEIPIPVTEDPGAENKGVTQ